MRNGRFQIGEHETSSLIGPKRKLPSTRLNKIVKVAKITLKINIYVIATVYHHT